MAGLFISYRRDDSQGFAGRLAQDLSQALGENRVFSDVEIPPGRDYAEVLHGAIAASDALLVVIGRRWAA
jgi:nucleotide-binding universal stress UspA family protein